MKTIFLPKPTTLKLDLTTALLRRRTNRDISDEGIDDANLAALLWACAGITSQDGRRTVPSALDLKLVKAYVLRADGAWEFDAKENALKQTTEHDVREKSTSYQFDLVKAAPVTVVFVVDTVGAKNARPGAPMIDAGTMAQSISLAAASLNLAGVIRASFDHDVLREAMEIDKTLEPILLYTVGHPKA